MTLWEYAYIESGKGRHGLGAINLQLPDGTQEAFGAVSRENALKVLNVAGQRGWELVGIGAMAAAPGDVLWLKRRVEPAEDV